MRGRGSSKHFGRKARTLTQQRAALGALLLNCRDDALLRLSAETLARSYGLPLAEVEMKLGQAKMARGVANG